MEYPRNKHRGSRIGDQRSQIGCAGGPSELFVVAAVALGRSALRSAKTAFKCDQVCRHEVNVCRHSRVGVGRLKVPCILSPWDVRLSHTAS